MTNKIAFGPGPSMPFLPGSTVGGKFRLERPLARGGMGFVALAHDLRRNLPVALKFMHAWIASEVPEGAARFLDEARAAARIRSEYVARVLDAGTFRGSPYMAVEYLDGEDLETILRRRQPIRVPLAVSCAVQASEGLASAHALGLLHRDLKPANLFLAKRRDGLQRIKVLDVGISKMVGSLEDPPATRDANDRREIIEASASTYGSPFYMAPERMLSAASADARSDVWSLGAVLYEMLAGVRPFSGETLAEVCARILEPRPRPIRAIRPEVPAALEAAVMQCLQRDPERRFRDVAAFAQALASSCPGTPGTTVARIRQIVHGSLKEALAQGPQHEPPPTVRAVAPPPPSPVPLPDRSLTDTSFNRAVEGVAHLMRVQGVTIRYGAELPPEPAPATPPRVPAPVTETPRVPAAGEAPRANDAAAWPAWTARVRARVAPFASQAPLARALVQARRAVAFLATEAARARSALPPPLRTRRALVLAGAGVALAIALVVAFTRPAEKPGRAETQSADRADALARVLRRAEPPASTPVGAELPDPEATAGSFDAPIDVTALPKAADAPRPARAPGSAPGASPPPRRAACAPLAAAAVAPSPNAPAIEAPPIGTAGFGGRE